MGDQASSESQQETIPVSPDNEVDDNISGDTLPYVIPTAIIEQPNDSVLREARIEEWLKKQVRNISHLLPEEYEEEAERTSSAATKTKNNPRQWKLPEGPFYSNMMVDTNTPKGKLLLVWGVDTPLISESKGKSSISPVRGVSGEIPMEKLINECNKIIEHEAEEDYYQVDIPEIGGVI